MLYRLQNKIPFIITLLGILYIISPILYYFYYVSLSGQSAAEISAVLNYAGEAFFWQFIAIMVITPIVGIGLVLKRKWGLVLFFVYGLALIIQNIVNWAIQPEMFNPPAVIGISLITAILLLFIRLELRAPFYRPEWKKRGRRFKIVHQVSWRKADESSTVQSETVDIAPAGCFIKSEAPPAHWDKLVVKIGETDFAGEVTWISPGTRRFPSGFGVKFDMYTPEQEKILHRIIGKA